MAKGVTGQTSCIPAVAWLCVPLHITLCIHKFSSAGFVRILLRHMILLATGVVERSRKGISRPKQAELEGLRHFVLTYVKHRTKWAADNGCWGGKGLEKRLEVRHDRSGAGNKNKG